MLVAEDGSTTGNVSGGCLEADVKEVALRVLASGHPEVRSYCGSADEIEAWDLGVGCEGQVEVLVEVPRDARGVERALLDGTVPFASCSLVDAPGQRLIVTAWESDGTLGDAALDVGAIRVARVALSRDRESAIRPVAGRDVFVDVFTPPPQLLILSGGEDARPLARFAAQLGFRVVVVDRRPALLTRDRFPLAAELVLSSPADLGDHVVVSRDTFAVVMTHSYADDRGWLRALLDTRAGYIGVLGPRQRTERMLAELAATGPVDESRVYGPVGLDIGTDGAEQVAMAALAEILAVRSGREPGSLRERPAPIHASTRH
jgi:xanthine/CO dehydrogenase XdhC/CoxF family maturation factor